LPGVFPQRRVLSKKPLKTHLGGGTIVGIIMAVAENVVSLVARHRASKIATVIFRITIVLDDLMGPSKM
jgi:hypothetical protein